jgi:hypothetical protein
MQSCQGRNPLNIRLRGMSGKGLQMQVVRGVARLSLGI